MLSYRECYKKLCDHFKQDVNVAIAKEYETFYWFIISPQELHRDQKVFVGGPLCVLKKDGSVIPANELEIKWSNLTWQTVEKV